MWEGFEVGARANGAEREARTAAERISGQPGSGLTAEAEAEDGPLTGRRLPPSARSLFERFLGTDLSAVRLHTDAAASQRARQLGARAFTVGDDVFFGAREYQPRTPAGAGLLAHELAHVAQQRPGEPLLVRLAPDDRAPGQQVPTGRTDYRFDTFRTTVADLSREDVLARFNDLELPDLRTYLAKTHDSAVAMYLSELIDVRVAEQVKLGERIVSNYMGLSPGQKTPGGACFRVARTRAEKASAEVAGVRLTEALTAKELSTFERLWGTIIFPTRPRNRSTERRDKESWLAIPEHVRGKGAPGALVFAGKGVFVEQDAIWAGRLEPGAVIQTWELASDAGKVKKGERPEGMGHSFIFLRYKREGNRPQGRIEGMEIADQGFQSGDVLRPGDWGWWIGANFTAPLRKFVRPSRSWDATQPGVSRPRMP